MGMLVGSPLDMYVCWFLRGLENLCHLVSWGSLNTIVVFKSLGPESFLGDQGDDRAQSPLAM